MFGDQNFVTVWPSKAHVFCSISVGEVLLRPMIRKKLQMAYFVTHYTEFAQLIVTFKIANCFVA